MNEKLIRQIVQYQLKDWYIRSCRLDIKTNRYIYEAYAPDQSIFTAYDPYYTLNMNGIVTRVNIAADPSRLFNAPIIWSDENNELAHAFKNPLKGIMREGHKYIQRLGDPGNYKYIYEKTKKATNTIGENIEDKLETIKNGSSKDNQLPVYNGIWDINKTESNKYEIVKFFDRPNIGNTPLLKEQFPKKENSYSLSSCKDESDFLEKRKKRSKRM